MDRELTSLAQKLEDESRGLLAPDGTLWFVWHGLPPRSLQSPSIHQDATGRTDRQLRKRPPIEIVSYDCSGNLASSAVEDSSTAELVVGDYPGLPIAPGTTTEFQDLHNLVDPVHLIGRFDSESEP